MVKNSVLGIIIIWGLGGLINQTFSLMVMSNIIVQDFKFLLATDLIKTKPAIYL